MKNHKMTASQSKTVAQYEANGWVITGHKTATMNRRTYRMVEMKRV
jgi:hypothetical protein